MMTFLRLQPQAKSLRAWLFAAAALWSAGAAWSANEVLMNLETLTRQADAIVVGRVQSRHSFYADNLVQTQYVIEASQYLKGNLGKRLTITQAGGSIAEPIPVTQVISGSTDLAKDEKVLLFLDTRNTSAEMREVRQNALQARAKAAQARAAETGAAVQAVDEARFDAPIYTSPRILGGWQGHFSIVPNAEGKEVAVQARQSSTQMSGSEESLAAMREMRAALMRRSASANADQEAGEMGGIRVPETILPSAARAAEEETVAAVDLLVPQALRREAQSIDEMKINIREIVKMQESDGLARPKAAEARPPYLPTGPDFGEWPDRKPEQ